MQVKNSTEIFFFNNKITNYEVMKSSFEGKLTKNSKSRITRKYFWFS